MVLKFSTKIKSKLVDWGFVWWYRDALYWLDSSLPGKKSVKEWLNKNMDIGAGMIAELPRFKGSNDQKVELIHKWVFQNIRYVSDFDRYKKMDYWQDIKQTLNNKMADCEDGAVLLYVLCRLNRISPAQLRFSCGFVRSPLGKEKLGHAWLEYLSDARNDFHPVDWCFSPEWGSFDIRRLTTENKLYLNYWFSVNEL